MVALLLPFNIIAKLELKLSLLSGGSKMLELQSKESIIMKIAMHLRDISCLILTHKVLIIIK